MYKIDIDTLIRIKKALLEGYNKGDPYDTPDIDKEIKAVIDLLETEYQLK